MIDSQSENVGPGLRHYLDVVRRRKWLVLALFAVTVATAVVVSELQQPKYRAETKLVIGQGQGLFSPTLANAFQPFSATMSDLLLSNVVARRVISDLSLDESEEALLAKVSVSIKPESSALKLSVVDTDPRRARAIAQDFGIVFSRLVERRFGKATPVGAGEAPLPPLTASVWDPAHIDPQKVSPRPVRNAALAGVLGLMLGLLAAFVREHFDRALRSRASIEDAFGTPVIGQIPFHAKRRAKRALVTNVFGDSSEAYRALRANLQYVALQRPLRTMLLTSAAPEQGKTTVTANLAVTIAQSGASTIVVDGDLRRPRLEELFKIDEAASPGLTGVLVGHARLEDAIVTLPLASTNGADEQTAATLAFLPSGYLPPNPSELLSSTQMQNVVAHLSASYDYVLVDSPPILVVADALELARMVDGVVLVARRNRATRDDAREVRALVERLELNLVGTVMTGAETPTSYYGDYGRARPSTVPSAPPAREPVSSRRS